MDPKFFQIDERHAALQARLADPAFQSSREYQDAAREFKRLEGAVQKVRALRALEEESAKANDLRTGPDPDLRQLAEDEWRHLSDRARALTAELEDFLLPKDPRDERDVIVEIRAGTGGDEAALFAGELHRMYTRYGQNRSFTVEPFDAHPTGLGGFKAVVFSLRGTGAYGLLKHESGVHRVQRVPATEASGRIHTSTATVAVMPEADEVDVTVQPSDLRIDVYRASGAGGQHVNKTESAVRITHLPTGVVVACQDERSQVKNRAKAMAMLRAKLYQAEQERRDSERRDLRRSQVGTGERHEKIRTYNFPQDRVTDHRINRSFHNLPHILEGHLEEIHAALAEADKAARLAEAGAA